MAEVVEPQVSRYQEYKSSGVEWLDEIPVYWSLCKLKRLVEVKDGTHDTPDYVEESANSIPLITSKDIKNGRISFADAKCISQEDYNEINKRSNVEFGDIRLTKVCKSVIC